MRSIFAVTLLLTQTLATLAGSAAIADGHRSREIDATVWNVVSATVAANDLDGMAATYHPDAVLVSPGGTVAIAEQMVQWGEGMAQIRAEGRSASVSFSFGDRQDDESTAFERGMFRYAQTDAAGVEQPVFIPFEALLAKKDGRWLVVMERQLEAADEGAWNETQAKSAAAGDERPAAPGDSHAHEAHPQPYAGMEVREIKSLSPEDLRELRAGNGWGLSLAAELNGVPGPKHLLELATELELSTEQIAAIEGLYREMKAEAVPLGEELIRLERELDQSFANGALAEQELAQLVSGISRVRGDLRHTHLLAHLRTPPLLTAEQIDTYGRLRGYGSADPCAAVPPGHDPEMWRRHNGCDG